METVLVTGAQGFTGRFVVDALLRAGSEYNVVGVGRSARNDTHFTHVVSCGPWRGLAPLSIAVLETEKTRYAYYACSLADLPALREIVHAVQPRVVFHLAAALRDDVPSALIETNVMGTINLLNAVGELRAKPKLVFGSSGSVYGSSPFCREDDCCAPSEPYAVSKLASEHCVKILAPFLDIDFVVARIFNIAGPGQDERHVCGKFAAQGAAIAAGLSEPQIAAGDLTPTRDFIDVRDVAEALILLARLGSRGTTYNVGSGNERPIREILDTVLRLAGVADRVDVALLPKREHDVSRQRADISRLRSLGYRPRFTIEETLRDIVDYYGILAAREGACT